MLSEEVSQQWITARDRPARSASSWRVRPVRARPAERRFPVSFGIAIRYCYRDGDIYQVWKWPWRWLPGRETAGIERGMEGPCWLKGERFQWIVAEGVGFEPTIRFPVYTLSKRAP